MQSSQRTLTGRSMDAGQRQACGLALDRLPPAGGQPYPRLDRQGRAGAAPGLDDLAFDEDAIRPDARRPEGMAVGRPRGPGARGRDPVREGTRRRLGRSRAGPTTARKAGSIIRPSKRTAPAPSAAASRRLAADSSSGEGVGTARCGGGAADGWRPCRRSPRSSRWCTRSPAPQHRQAECRDRLSATWSRAQLNRDGCTESSRSTITAPGPAATAFRM